MSGNKGAASDNFMSLLHYYPQLKRSYSKKTSGAVAETHGAGLTRPVKPAPCL